MVSPGCIARFHALYTFLTIDVQIDLVRAREIVVVGENDDSIIISLIAHDSGGWC